MATYKSKPEQYYSPVIRSTNYPDITTKVYWMARSRAFELIGFAKVSNKSGTKANFKSFDITIPSPDRRPDDRVRDDRTSLVVQASSDRLLMCIYGASLAIAQDIPAGG